MGPVPDALSRGLDRGFGLMPVAFEVNQGQASWNAPFLLQAKRRERSEQ
jgi:hypothetical protein